jgi:hypothetical protein
MILRAIAMSPEKVISIATDGIVVTEELDLEYGEELGEWDIKKLSGFAQLSNGVYHATDMAKNKPIDRARGLGRGVLDYDKKSAMYRAWRDSKGMGSFTYKGRTRFITHREARNHSNRDDVKCRWIDDKYRTMKFCPERRLPWPDKAARKRDLLGTRLMSYRDYPTPDHHADEESQPFRVKTKSQEVHDARALNHPRTWYDAA